jgi:hypothetical protein
MLALLVVLPHHLEALPMPSAPPPLAPAVASSTATTPAATSRQSRLDAFTPTPRSPAPPFCRLSTLAHLSRWPEVPSVTFEEPERDGGGAVEHPPVRPRP